MVLHNPSFLTSLFFFSFLEAYSVTWEHPECNFVIFKFSLLENRHSHVKHFVNTILMAVQYCIKWVYPCSHNLSTWSLDPFLCDSGSIMTCYVLLILLWTSSSTKKKCQHWDGFPGRNHKGFYDQDYFSCKQNTVPHVVMVPSHKIISIATS